MGRVTRVVGLVIEAAGLDVGLGELCRVTSLSEELGRDVTVSEVVPYVQERLTASLTREKSAPSEPVPAVRTLVS